MTVTSESSQGPVHDLIIPVTLQNIASWQIPDIRSATSPEWLAGIPALQRGLVWDAQQIEFLWDSLMQGYPVGSIVVTDVIAGQSTKPSDIIQKAIGLEPSHHVLDGQQRCNAIAWGFANPWQTSGNSASQILWIDLAPKLKNSTRQYLFRLTTKAHPWGFAKDDASGPVGIDKRQEFLRKWEDFTRAIGDAADAPWFHAKDQKSLQGRPLPQEGFPIDACFPVPMAVLIQYFQNGQVDWDGLAAHAGMRHATAWHRQKVGDLTAEQKNAIERGLSLLGSTEVAVLRVLNNDGKACSMEKIEQIFVRLNRQGARLDNEDLVYSMLKVHWEELDKIMAGLNAKSLAHITEARLVNLGIRVALTPSSGASRLKPELSVEEVRRISLPSAAGPDRESRQELQDYFSNKKELEQALSWIDGNFLFCGKKRPFGIPAYLRSSLAWSSRPVFAWLMYLAKYFDYKPLDDDKAKRILGWALAVHWFSDE